MRACIRCGNTSGYTLIGGSCITCEYDDSDCDELVAEGKAQAVEETVAAIVAWLRSRSLGDQSGVMIEMTADAIERGDWKK